MSSVALRPTPEQVSHARRLILSANLETVRLVHVRAANMTIPGCPVKTVEERAFPSASATLIEGSYRFRVFVTHSIHGRRGAENTSAEVQIDASFELIYSYPQDQKFNPEELQAFADTNALMNSWPYWRELVQNTVARMNLPALMVPLLRYVPPPSEQPADAKAHSEVKPNPQGKAQPETKPHPEPKAETKKPIVPKVEGA